MRFKHLFLTITVFFSFLHPSFAQGPTILRHGGSVQTVLTFLTIVQIM